MTAPTVDKLASICGSAALMEAQDCMKLIDPDHDMTACEKVALLTLLAPIRDRIQHKPAPVLRLASRRNRST